MSKAAGKKKACLLLHGICSSGAVFGPSIGPGLAHLLAENFRVYVGFLRERGKSFAKPLRFATEIHAAALTRGGGKGKNSWDFDDHLETDIPAIWQECCRIAGEAPFVLGYSMGGMLALAAQARGLLKTSRLMVVGSPVVFPAIPFYPPMMRAFYQFAGKTGIRTVPIRLAARLLYWYFRFVLRERPKGSLSLFHLLGRRAGANIPFETLGQALHWVESGNFCDRTAKRNYLDDLRKITIPAMFVAGELDRIAPPKAVLEGYARVSSRQKHFLTLPGATHLDLVAGDGLYQTAKIAKAWFLSSF